MDRQQHGGRHAEAAERGELAPPPAATDVELPENPTLEHYIAVAMANNPGLEATFQEWKAALARVPQARSLPDPHVSYRYFVRESMTQQSVMLSQAFPWHGRLRAEADAALEAARAVEQRFESERLALVARVKDAYAEYAYLRQALDVMEENRRILEDFVEAARARFEIAGVRADVVRAEVAVEQAADEIASLEARRRPISARLNAAMGRPSHAPLPWPEPLQQPTLDAREQQLLTWLAEANPELRALRHEAGERRQMLRVARQNRIPDLELGVEYMDMVPADMRDQVALSASMNLPIWGGRLDAERAEALAAFGATARRRLDRENQLQSELQIAYYGFRDAQRRAELFEQRLIPMAREALDATRGAYAEGEAEFEALTRAQTDLQELQLTYQRALAERFQKLAELERLVGRQLSGKRASEPAIDVEEPQAADPQPDE